MSFTCFAHAQDEKLPTLSEMKLPPAEHFLNGDPVDWVVLKDDTVVVTEPILPRPNTLKKIKEAIEASLNWPRPKSLEERKEQIQKREKLNYVNVVFKLDGEVQEYELHSKHIDDVIFHEDLMLRRIDKLIEEKQLPVANELLFRMQRRKPVWSGVNRKRNKLLLAEAQNAFGQKNQDLALIRLEELFRRDPEYNQLSKTMGQVHNHVIEAAIGKKDYRQTRFFLERLNKHFPEHPVGKKWRTQLQNESEQLMVKAQQASAKKEHKQAVEIAYAANRIWPLATTDSHDLYRAIQQRYQQIKVGVLDLGKDKTSYPYSTSAKRRIEHLTLLKLFTSDRLDDAPHYNSPLFEEWTPLDLGRQLKFSIKPAYSPWESKPSIQAAEVVDTIAQRLQIDHPLYNERMDHFINHITIDSPFHFRIYFDEVPVRPEALFRFPVFLQQPTSSADQPQTKTLAQGKRMQITKRFQLDSQSDSQSVYVRANRQADGLAEYHLAEISEQQFPDDELAIRALRQEKVDMLTKLPTWAVAGMQKDKRFIINKYMLPVTHVIQFNPANKALRNPQLRRALIYALDRREILNRFLLHSSDGKHGRLTTAPFTQTLGGYNKLITPRPADPALGFALAIAAKRQLEGKLPKLKLLCSPEQLARTGAQKVIESWARIQVEVELIETEQATDSEWDLVYRTVRMDDPYSDLWPFLTFEDRARIASLKHFPDWLRQRLISLDQATDKGAAIAMMQELHEKLWFEAVYIPLWEINEYYAINRKISGPLQNPITPYQNIEQWIVKP